MTSCPLASLSATETADRVEPGVISSRGRLAQLGERLPYKQEVAGSIPAPPIAVTMRHRDLFDATCPGGFVPH